ncbi:hypothetical protein ACWEKT_03085 [Nocardia takedensis]
MTEDQRDIYSRAADLFDKLAARLPTGELRSIRSMLDAGEVVWFVEYLIGTLYHSRCPIARDEFDELRGIVYSFHATNPDYRHLIHRDVVMADLVIHDISFEEPPMAAVGSNLPYWSELAALDFPTLRELTAREVHRDGRFTESFDWVLLEWATTILELRRDVPADLRILENSESLIHMLRGRDAIAQELPCLSVRLRSVVERWVAAYDELYLSLTVPNPGGWLVQKANVGREEAGEWWFRVPARGLVAEEYEARRLEFEAWKRDRAARKGSAGGE